MCVHARVLRYDTMKPKKLDVTARPKWTRTRVRSIQPCDLQLCDSSLHLKSNFDQFNQKPPFLILYTTDLLKSLLDMTRFPVNSGKVLIGNPNFVTFVDANKFKVASTSLIAKSTKPWRMMAPILVVGNESHTLCDWVGC